MRSNFERTFAADLTRRGIAFKFEPERIPYVETHEYIPDFKIGSMYIETKGYLKPSDRSKMKQIKKQYPELDIRFVFMSADNRLTAKSKTTYGEWAEKNGFPWCESVIPQEWLNEC